MRLEKVQEVCLRRGIIFPSAEIYGSVAGFYEWGPIGFSIKKNFIEAWRDFFIKPYGFYEIEGSLVLPEKVFEASGHLKGFVDPITQCENCKTIHRADHLIEECTKMFVEGKSEEELTEIIREKGLKCPRCGGNLSEVRMFNLMLKTEISPVGGIPAYLRPETAQNIFTSFSRIFKAMRGKLPFGIAQIGKSFRNEISPRRFLIRLREFHQAEIEVFFDPDNPECPFFHEVEEKDIPLLTREAQKEGKEASMINVKEAVETGLIPNEWLGFFLAKEFEFYTKLGIPPECLRFRHMLPEETPHYSKGNFDLEIKFDFGWKEVVGNAYRTDYDLRRHSEFSKKDLSVDVNGKKVLPHVVEPSFGIDRTILAVLLFSFREKGYDRDWNWMKLPNFLAPFHAAVFPLVSKDGLPEKAREIFEVLKKELEVFYDEKGSIGKRYARADEIGIPACVTIDYQTMEDETVTIRDRDTKQQKRVKIEKLVEEIRKIISY